MCVCLHIPLRPVSSTAVFCKDLPAERSDPILRHYSVQSSGDDRQPDRQLHGDVLGERGRGQEPVKVHYHQRSCQGHCQDHLCPHRQRQGPRGQ